MQLHNWLNCVAKNMKDMVTILSRLFTPDTCIWNKYLEAFIKEISKVNIHESEHKVSK